MKIIFRCSLRSKMKIHRKKKVLKKRLNLRDFSRFLTKNFQTRSPAERKNDFRTKILLETCSATSNYLWN